MIMNTPGALRRPRLSLKFSDGNPRRETGQTRRPATLDQHELRQIVAAMLG